MAACLSSRAVVLGVALFAALYLLGGAMMVSVGLVALFHMPDVFSTGCIIWTGIVIFLSGTVLLLMVLCNKSISLWKSYVMMVLCLTVLCVSVANIILTEMVEWAGVRDSATARNRSTIFPTYLLALLGSCIGVVASLVGTAYVYCTLIVPQPTPEERSKSQYEAHIMRSTFQKYNKKPQRKFNFKLTPSPDSREPPAVDWANGESDLYHVSWVYEDQEQIAYQFRQESTFVPPDQPGVDYKQALVNEIKERFDAHRIPSMSLDVTAQMNIDSGSGPSQTHPDESLEPSTSRPHNMAPDATSSFHKGYCQLDAYDQSTHL